jgi:hypothetical protein
MADDPELAVAEWLYGPLTPFCQLPDGELITGLTEYQGRLFANTQLGHCYEIFENHAYIRMDAIPPTV